MAIIAILAAIAVPNFLEAQVRSRVSRAKADHRALATALESYYVDYNSYPPDGNDRADFDFNAAARLSVVTTPVAYMLVLPNDPFNKGDQSRVYGLFDPLNFMFPGDPPYTYAYNTIGELDPMPPTPQNPANKGRPDNWGLTSIGPSRQFDSAIAQETLLYDPSNGTISPGDIVRKGGQRYDY